MSYGLNGYGHRRRRQFWLKVGRVGVFLVVLALTFGFAYQIGVEQLKNRTVSLSEEIAALTAAKEAAEQRAAAYQQRAQNAEVRADELEVRYQRDVPSGDLGRLKDLVARKLAEGVDPGRLAFVIDQTGTPRACGEAEIKRFVLATPLYKGQNTSVAFGDGAVTVTGDGTSFRNAEGNPEAWFDPTKSVTMRFVLPDGTTTKLSGVLPIENAVVVQDREYRFRITAGARSFVEVAGSSCPFP